MRAYCIICQDLAVKPKSPHLHSGLCYYASPLISIVLPTYNGSRYLAESIESCLIQTFSAFELVIVDDCSTDSSPEIIASYAAKDPRIRPFRNAQNLKLPASLNKGFREARGTFFTWTSDDNLYNPYALEVMVRELQGNPGLDVVYAGYTLIDAEGRKGEDNLVLPPNRLGIKNCVNACFLHRRKVFEDLGGYAEDLFTAEDYDFWLRAFAKFTLKELPVSLYFYRLHEGSLTTQKAALIEKLTTQILIKHLPHLSKLTRQEKAEAWRELAEKAWRREDKNTAHFCFLRSLWQTPRIALNNQDWRVATRMILGPNLEQPVRGAWKRLKHLGGKG